MLLSIVIPVCNEVESLVELHAQLDVVSTARDYELQVIFVDDGSRDGSWETIERLAASDPRVQGIRFRRNFGKAAALSAGFEAARGDMVLTLDADLQDDPAEIPNFLVEIERGFDVVSGWKKVRHDPWHKVFPSRVFNGLVSWLTGVQLHDHNCGMKCYRRDVLGEVRLYGELHRFVPVLAAARGFRVGEVVIQHRPRQFGHSKYGVRRFIKGFLDLLTVKFMTSFGERPQHILGSIGLVLIALGIVRGLWHVAAGPWSLTPEALSLEQLNARRLLDLHVLVSCLGAWILGVQFLGLGLLAETIVHYFGRDANSFSIVERTPRAAPARLT